MSVTIKEVAADAGVSIATVSHVINKTRYVSQEVCDKVNASIAKLNYYPNHLVGGLRKNKTYTIGLIIPSISNETFGALTENIQKRFLALGYNLILCNTSYDSKLEERALNTLIMKKVDGVIIIPAYGYSDKIREIKEMNIPIILIDRIFESLNIDTVRVDNFKGEYEIISYLIAMGHRNIGYIDRMVAQSHSEEQRGGYIEALKSHGIALNPDNIVHANGYYYQSGIDAVKALLKANPEITAISAYYDVIAFGAMRGLIDMGYRVPEDISVVGYDGMPFTEATCPRLTTVLTPIREMADEICQLILKRLEEKDRKVGPEESAPAANIVIQPKLILRESVKDILHH